MTGSHMRYGAGCASSGQAHTFWLMLPLLLLFSLLSGCALSPLQQARTFHQAGNAQAALRALGDIGDISSRNRLLFRLEKGLILHESGDYAGSVQELLAAAEQVESNDYLSVADEAKALLANDWARRYNGEYSEQLWIHSYLMMNFLLLGEYESAAVEARRALQRIDRREELLGADLFTRALMGLSLESAGQTNGAFIEYSKLADALPHLSGLQATLWRQASALGFVTQARRLKSGLSAAERSQPHAELVLFVSSGQLPQKVTGSLLTDHDERVAFPQYLPSSAKLATPKIVIDSADCACESVSSDLGLLARNSLAARAGSITARLVGRAVAKDAFADTISKEDQVAGEVVKLILFVLEEADTRGWEGLPENFSLIRVPVNKEDREVQVQVAGLQEGAVLIDVSDSKRGEKRFFSLRL